MTFSVVAYDPEKDEWGVAVASKYLSVGSVVPWAIHGVGCVATQAMANYSYGPNGLSLLKEKGAEETIKSLTSVDNDREHRQIGVVDRHGNAASFTGKKCFDYAGSITGKNFAVQGNILAGPEVLKRMAAVMERSGPLEFRLLDCLKAGESAGGDRRGRQSAAILIASKEREFEPDSGKFMEIRVEDHSDPVTELERIRDLWLLTFYDNEMVSLEDYRDQINSKIKSLGYSTIEQWASINNFEHNLKDGKIGRKTLDYLLSR
ncbi:MAG: DUF1028 domain-containing protein [Candidatus Thermoplasmatota archaeon]|nr:DUF1028 domain-containing protein [Candidatus Thermoplasmatota archaeon]